MKLYLVTDWVNDVVRITKPVTPEKAMRMYGAVTDPPYSIVKMQKGQTIFEFDGRYTENGETRILEGNKTWPAPMSTHVLVDRDGCIWVYGSKEALEECLTLMHMIEGTEAMPDKEPEEISL